MPTKTQPRQTMAPTGAKPTRRYEPVPPARPQTIRLTPQMVARARRGAELKAIIAAAEAELKPIDQEFTDLFEASGIREATNASGKVVATYNHGNGNPFHEKEFKAAHPALALEFSWERPWDKPAYTS